MIELSQIQDTIDDAKFFLVNESKLLRLKLQFNSKDCDLGNLKLINWLIKTISIDLNLGFSDKCTEFLYKWLHSLIKGSVVISPIPPPEPILKSIIYIGWKDSIDTLNNEQIKLSSPNEVNTGTDYTLNLTLNVLFYTWFSEPITEPVKTKWEDIANPLNKGIIGGNDDLFGTPVTVGDYRFYITNYPTVFSNPTKFIR